MTPGLALSLASTLSVTPLPISPLHRYMSTVPPCNFSRETPISFSR
ncbi:hypothetical protein GLYMA_19G034100v4 [Glycine max]|uniref:Uncharacterized protein n=1 Tax=Glycine max TaxID=3847 RepID=A0A0R0EUE7_SOYBN|nr:hypothetical protein GYH30_051929 [Glycine max]KAH1076251.1 hypothetical protein GYH30_051929 [Glycine max]KRG93693.1 hypothetical protein GLYMA_19G034100v4 [Glycine max]KRG93694.1 hypothetical protein GLYMA_19G034100v4 [Glycine max]